MDIRTSILFNGLRIIHLKVASPIAYCGFAVHAGARDEKNGEFGLAHFVEHTLFKGTIKRKAWHIINRMENVGGDLNAYTSKEETIVYSIFMEKDFERATELISDLLVNSQFPQKEIEKEREVIIDEIQLYEDTPSELIFDEFENLLFRGHPLGHHILGDRRSLMSFNSASGRSFLERYYTADNMVFFVMSSTDFKKVASISEKYLNAIPGRGDAILRKSPPKKAPKTLLRNKKTHQSHCIVGGRAYSLFDEKKYALFLLSNILGGPGMNSRLNVSLREKRGLAYTVESNVTSYTDTGVLSIYFGTDSKNREWAMELVGKELEKLRTTKLTTAQLAAAKKQAMGQLGVAGDNRENLFLALGKSFLHHDRYETLPETFEHLEKVTSEAIIETANEILAPDGLYTLIYE